MTQSQGFNEIASELCAYVDEAVTEWEFGYPKVSECWNSDLVIGYNYAHDSGGVHLDHLRHRQNETAPLHNGSGIFFFHPDYSGLCVG